MKGCPTSLQELSLPALFQKAWDAQDEPDSLTDAQIEVRYPCWSTPNLDSLPVH